jgi:hypothetical protein
MSNVECQRNVFYLLNINKPERSDSTLRHSLFDIRYSAVGFSMVLRFAFCLYCVPYGHHRWPDT